MKLTKLMQLFFIVVSICMLASCATTTISKKINITTNVGKKIAETAETAEISDMIIKNGVVFTADNNNKFAEAVAVKKSKIIYVGTNSEVEKLRGDTTKVIDLEGKMLLPGMIDSHIHSPGTMLDKLYLIDLNGVLTEEETIKKIEEYVKNHPDLPIYYGSGFSVGAFKGEEVSKGPKKERLDAISANKAIIIDSYDGHSSWLNSKAFEQFAITKKTKAPAGGVIEKDANGELWGTLKESAQRLVPSKNFTAEQKLTAAKSYQKYLHSLGYTGIMSMTGAKDEFVLMDKKGELKMYVNNAIVIDPQKDLKKQIQSAISVRDAYSSQNYRVNTLKFFADGVVEGVTAYLLKPYAKAANKGKNFRGTFLWNMKKLKKSFVLANKNKFQIHVHSIGDGSTRNVLNALEYAKNKLATRNSSVGEDYRNVITHLQLVADDDIKRFAKLKVIAATQPFWGLKEPKWWEVVDYPFLAERAEKEYPLQSFIKAGVIVTASSDHSVTPIPNPFWAIEVGVTRNLETPEYYSVDEIKDIDDPKWLLNPLERASIKDMIKAYTINGAYQNFIEKITGSIEVGKNADMIIVDKDITKVNPLTIDSSKVVHTIFNGEIVY
ncbi:MAG: amidohydrolase [Oligoflexia bacterium]|nr:amidohydrolase [Oligoflexia bacterium]